MRPHPHQPRPHPPQNPGRRYYCVLCACIKPHPQKPVGGVSLFGDALTASLTSPPLTRKSEVKSSGGGLFSDEDTDGAIDQLDSSKEPTDLFLGEDLFGAPPTVTPPTDTRYVNSPVCVCVCVCDVPPAHTTEGRSQPEQSRCLVELIYLVPVNQLRPYPLNLLKPLRSHPKAQVYSTKISMVKTFSLSHHPTRRTRKPSKIPPTHTTLTCYTPSQGQGEARQISYDT